MLPLCPLASAPLTRPLGQANAGLADTSRAAARDKDDSKLPGTLDADNERMIQSGREGSRLRDVDGRDREEQSGRRGRALLTTTALPLARLLLASSAAVRFHIRATPSIAAFFFSHSAQPTRHPHSQTLASMYHRLIKPPLQLAHDLLPGALLLSTIIFVVHQCFHASAQWALLIGAIVAGSIPLVRALLRPLPQPDESDPLVRWHRSRKLKGDEFAHLFERQLSNTQLGVSSAAEAAAAAASANSKNSAFTSEDGEQLATHRVSLSTPHALVSRIRQLDLTPLIRIDLAPTRRSLFPASLDRQHLPDLHHLKGGKHFVVNVVCGPRLMLRMAKWAVGSHRFKSIGALTGKQILSLLKLHERYNFILADHPPRIVISHVGIGQVGGLYAKHALLSELGRVSFAGEMWVDESRCLHVNNSSGTYQPKDDLLEDLQRFLGQALQIEVRAHRRPNKDEQDEETIKQEAESAALDAGALATAVASSSNGKQH